MTLTELSFYTRRSAPLVIIGGILLIFFYAIISLLILRPSSNSKAEIVLNPAFGKIGKIVVENSLDYPQNPEFILDNIEGRPTTASSAANVYFLPKSKTRFGYLEAIYQMARSSNFDTESIKHNIEGGMATFKDGIQSLLIDIGNYNFTYKYNFEELNWLFTNTSIPNETSITQTARSYLEKMGRFPTPLGQGREQITYMAYNPATQKFTVLGSPRDANVVEIDYFRPDEEGFPVFSPQYFTSHNYVVIAYPEGEPIIIKSQIKFFERDTSNIGTYPLKNGDKAWKDLSSKKAIVIANQNPSNSIIIQDMFLAYLDPDVYQQYLQPVYVFLGENNFVAFVQAVKDEFIE